MGKNQGMDFAAIGLGLITSAGTELILILAGTKLLLSEKIGEGGLNGLLSVTLLLGVMIGGWAAVRKGGKQWIGPAAVAGVNFLLLFIAGLLMEGGFCDIWLRIATAVAGFLLCCVFFLKNRQQHGRRKRRHR